MLGADGWSLLMAAMKSVLVSGHMCCYTLCSLHEYNDHNDQIIHAPFLPAPRWPMTETGWCEVIESHGLSKCLVYG